MSVTKKTDRPRELHFPPLYTKGSRCLQWASKLYVAGFVWRIKKPFGGLVKALGDVVDDLV